MNSDLDGYNLDQLADAALAASSASFTDVRIIATRTGYLTHRDNTAMADVNHLDLGVGVRVLVQGCWGFAATSELTPEAVAQATRAAQELAQAAAPTVTTPVVLAPEPTVVGEWRSGWQTDPFTVDPATRREFLAGHCASLLEAGVSHSSASVMSVREDKFYASSTGSRTQQQRVRVQAEFTGIQITDDGGFETLRTTAPPVGAGWEYFSGTDHLGPSWDWRDEIAQLPTRLQEKVQAPSVTPGAYDLLLDPTNLWLTIHESIGHATELDRVWGYEANYAGTSFATTEKLGNFAYGSPLLTVTGDRTTPHGLATVAWDDEGVAAQDWELISDGTLVGYQLDRSMAGQLSPETRSNGCAFADSGLHVPIQRMPNVSMQPTGTAAVEDLISGIEDGIWIIGDNSWSIDMQRYNFQFTGQRCERIKNGKLVGQVKDVVYQGVTPQFWGSLTAVGGPQTYRLGGAFNCGKGQPGQVAPVSHGCPAAVFTQVNVLNSQLEGTK